MPVVAKKPLTSGNDIEITIAFSADGTAVVAFSYATPPTQQDRAEGEAMVGDVMATQGYAPTRA